MYFRILFILLAIYILYRFLFDFVIPIYRQSKKIHRQFQHMQDQMNGQSNQDSEPFKPGPTPRNTPPQSPRVDKDYIDFEEVKD